jgi:hypothetical protein
MSLQVSGATAQYPKNGGGYVTVFEPQYETPIAQSGASLAGTAESTLETYYTTTDQVLFGTNRSDPFAISAPANEPAGASVDAALATFVNSNDAVVSQAIVALITSMFPPNSGVVINIGTLTVTFKDGTTAEYVQTGPGEWTWNGIAHDAKGNQINRNGTKVTNPNGSSSSSSSGAASANAPSAPENHTSLAFLFFTSLSRNTMPCRLTLRVLTTSRAARVTHGSTGAYINEDRNSLSCSACNSRRMRNYGARASLPGARAVVYGKQPTHLLGVVEWRYRAVWFALSSYGTRNYMLWSVERCFATGPVGTADVS